VWNAVEEKRVTQSTQREEAQSFTEIGKKSERDLSRRGAETQSKNGETEREED
jgi:hypothetical protein